MTTVRSLLRSLGLTGSAPVTPAVLVLATLVGVVAAAVARAVGAGGLVAWMVLIAGV